MDILPFTLENRSIREMELFYRQNLKLKKLSGFQNGKHFMPKYYSKSLEEFVGNISVREIEDFIKEPADALRKILNLKIDEYNFEVNPADGGYFQCDVLNYQVQLNPDREKLTNVWLSAILTLKSCQTDPEYLPGIIKGETLEFCMEILGAFSFIFQEARIHFEKPLELRSFIARFEKHFENYYNSNLNELEWHYDAGVSYLMIEHEESGQKIRLESDQMIIYFSSRFGPSELLNLWCANTGGVLLSD